MRDKLVRGFTQSVIKQNVQLIEEEGLDEDTALAVAISYARGLFKRDNPASTIFPKHLIPSLAVKMYRESKGGVIDGDPQEESQG